MSTSMRAEAMGRNTVKIKKTRGSAQLPSICQPSHAAMRNVRRFSRNSLVFSPGAVVVALIILPHSNSVACQVGLLPSQAQSCSYLRQSLHQAQHKVGSNNEDDPYYQQDRHLHDRWQDACNLAREQ